MVTGDRGGGGRVMYPRKSGCGLDFISHDVAPCFAAGEHMIFCLEQALCALLFSVFKGRLAYDTQRCGRREVDLTCLR